MAFTGLLTGSGLRFHFTAKSLPEDSFDVLDFCLDEALSNLFNGEITVLSRNDKIKAEAIVDQEAVLSWSNNGEVVRHIHGVVSAFSKADTGHKHTQYHIKLVPAMARLALRSNSRIFQQHSVVDVISTLLGEMGIDDYAFSCDQRHQSQLREYCVQYAETDLEFISRLAAEEGLFYYFEHMVDKHTLIFCDSTTKLTTLAAAFSYNATSGGQSDEPFINGFKYKHSVKTANVSLKDYSFKKPQYSFLHSVSGKDLAHQKPDYEHFDYPGRYKSDAAGKPISQSRLDYLRRHSQLAEADSNIMQAAVASKFNLQDHGDSSFNRDWLIVSARHTGEQGGAAEEANTEKPTRYRNSFKAIPGHKPWQAKPTPKPLVTGPQIATVSGPENEEIYCDEFGRVKVQFPWDRYGQNDELASCWIRVSQGWAGGQYGFMAIPRIGHEVIVSFLEGDPDQPIITGRTYHSNNVTPYILPNHKTRTVLRTNTHKGDGSNELRFEDEASREQIYIHGEKDLDIIIKNIHRENIGNDQHITVGHDQFELIKQHRHSTIGKDDIGQIGRDKQWLIGSNLIEKIGGAVKRLVNGGVLETIGGARQTSIGASEEKIIGANQQTKVNNESYLKAAKIVLEAGQELTIKGPGGFIKIDSGGVTISGNKVKINEGGSPGTGTSPKAVTPDDPAQPSEPQPADKR